MATDGAGKTNGGRRLKCEGFRFTEVLSDPPPPFVAFMARRARRICPTFVARIAMALLARVLAPEMPDWLFWTFMPVLYGTSIRVSSPLFIVVEKPISLQPSPMKVAKAIAR
jgi:peptidoglycan/LPS O-acetylase OafA/YrhL